MEKEEISDQTVKRFHPDVKNGLSKEQIQKRVSEKLVNYDTTIPTKSIKRIIGENIFTLFNFINFILAAAILFVGSYKNLLFFGVVICNLAIGIFQEIRAKKTVDKLSILSAPKIQTVRGGKTQEIGINDIVLDEVIALANGNQIPADSIILDGECDVNESLITGESDLIHKKTGDMLLSGSFIVSGYCTARVEHIGIDNYAAKISQDAKYLKKLKSEIMDSLNQIIKVISILIIPVGFLLFWGQMQVSSNTFQSAVVQTAAALVGMIPEGLILLTSTVLAVSVIRLSRHKVLVQELYCIESLARVDVLCLDKTGTITQGDMELKGIEPIQNTDRHWIDTAMCALAFALQNDSNPTFDAVKAAYPAAKSNWTSDKVIPFSSERKWSGAHFKGYGSLLLGAPEFLFRGQTLPFQKKLDEFSAENRVIILAFSETDFKGYELPDNLTAKAFVLIRDKMRPSANQTLQYFAEQGVDLKVISGDNVLTVAGIARRAGLADADSFVDAATLATEQDIRDAAEKYTVFGRVTPMQKKQLVLALQEKGHTVAMTGDGVNDVLALKEADCSIAMASGSEAARNVSKLVLLDSDFEAMPKVVAEGRRSINNIQRSASLFLVKTIYATILALIFVFARTNYPFIPIQLTLISVLTIGIPSFILALEPNHERIKGNFITNVISKAIPGALAIVSHIILLMTFSWLFGFHQSEFSTMCVVGTGCIGLLNLFHICLPFDKIRKILFAAMCTGFIAGIVLFRNLFSLTVFTIPMAGLSLSTLFISGILYYAFAYLFRKITIRKKRQ